MPPRKFPDFVGIFFGVAGFFLRLGSELRRFCGGVRWEKLGDVGNGVRKCRNRKKTTLARRGKSHKKAAGSRKYCRSLKMAACRSKNSGEGDEKGGLPLEKSGGGKAVVVRKVVERVK